jgi:hypothetical protein
MVDWQAEIKNRSVTELAGDSDRAAVRLDDGLRDGQSHTRSLDLKTLVLAAIEFVKDQAYFHIFDARALIGDARDQRSIAHFR